jgi:hypothetical protein
VTIDLDDNAGDKFKILTIDDDRISLNVYVTNNDIRDIANFLNDGKDYIISGYSGGHKVYWSRDMNGSVYILLDDIESWSVSIKLSDEEINGIRIGLTSR